MELTAADIATIPAGNLHVPRGEFVVVWAAAEKQQDDQVRLHATDWHGAGILATCRWLANATVRPAAGPWRMAPSPVTRRQVSAYEELIDAECLAAEKMLLRQPVPVWVQNRQGWVEAILATLNWAWRRTAVAPIDVGHRVGR